MGKIYRNSENKYTARKLIFSNDVSNYCYHDFALTKKMTKEELCEAVSNGALYVDVTANNGCSDDTPPNEFVQYNAISDLNITSGYSSIGIVGANTPRFSAEYTGS